MVTPRRRRTSVDIIEAERRTRIRVSLFAYAYECEHDSLVSDAEFDKLALTVRPDIATGHAVLDKFFREEFDACTGSWIHAHPELHKVRKLYRRLKHLWVKG